MRFRIGKIAEIAGVSVRTLHYYDKIGLLVPAKLNEAGYRLYDEDDAARLQEILFFRELGFALADVKKIMERPDYDRRAALLTHKEILLAKKKRLDDVIRSVDKALESVERGTEMTADDMFGAFDNTTVEKYKEEARERWGGTAAYKESERRTAKYKKEDWEKIQAESGSAHNAMAEALDAGLPPDSTAAQDAARRWFEVIDKYFYACTPEIFKGLGEMYVADPRFKKFYEGIRPGLAEYAKQAMAVYAGRLE